MHTQKSTEYFVSLVLFLKFFEIIVAVASY